MSSYFNFNMKFMYIIEFDAEVHLYLSHNCSSRKNTKARASMLDE